MLGGSIIDEMIWSCISIRKTHALKVVAQLVLPGGNSYDFDVPKECVSVAERDLVLAWSLALTDELSYSASVQASDVYPQTFTFPISNFEDSCTNNVLIKMHSGPTRKEVL